MLWPRRMRVRIPPGARMKPKTAARFNRVENALLHTYDDEALADIKVLAEEMEAAQEVLREIEVSVVLADDLSLKAQLTALLGVVDRHSAIARKALGELKA